MGSRDRYAEPSEVADMGRRLLPFRLAGAGSALQVVGLDLQRLEAAAAEGGTGSSRQRRHSRNRLFRHVSDDGGRRADCSPARGTARSDEAFVADKIWTPYEQARRGANWPARWDLYGGRVDLMQIQQTSVSWPAHRHAPADRDRGQVD